MKNQDHLIHIISLGVFILVLMIIQAYDALRTPVVTLSLGAAYIAINILADYKNRKIETDRVLEYVVVAALANVVLLSL